MLSPVVHLKSCFALLDFSVIIPALRILTVIRLNMKKIFCVFIVSLFVSGCGHQGALYLPHGTSGENLGTQSGKAV